MSENENKPIIQSYDENQIDILEGLEAVRKRPGMYIGTTSGRGLHHLVWEIVDNSIDEHLAGFCQNISVTVHKDNSITVIDDGRGIPVGDHPKMGIPTLEVVLTVLHAGGKFGGPGSGYKVSGGLHGVGSSCVNALSIHMIATVKRDGHIYQMEFSRGKKIKDLEIIGTCDENETGTIIWFKPDPEIFKETTTYEYDVIFKRMRENAYLNKGLVITVSDERKEVEDSGEMLSQTLCFERGIEQFVEFINHGKKTLHEKPIYFRDTYEDNEVEVALQYHNDFTRDGIFSFTNNIKTPEGGTHETGFKTALTNAIKQYIQSHELMKGKKELPNGDDTRTGLTAIISVKVPDPQFEGQTKAKLGNSEVRTAVDSVTFYQLTKYFEENPHIATSIIDKIIQATEIRLAMKKAREAELKKRKIISTSFPDPEKLTPANIDDPSKNELYLVEGDSAGGTAKVGRDRDFQAILPLRGKVLNTEKANMSKILDNKEIEAMRFAIGTDMGENFDYEKLNYDKVVIMTDADVDGAHISTLLLTFFYRYMRPLIERGHVYLAMPPLYKVESGKKIEYAYDDAELEKLLKTEFSGKKPAIQRYKGLGEMNAEQLWDTTMNPETRTLLRVEIDDLAEAENLFTQLMGDDVQARRDFIQKNSHLANIDA